MAKKTMAESSTHGATKRVKKRFPDGYFKSTHARDMLVVGRISYQKVFNACRVCDFSVSCLKIIFMNVTSCRISKQSTALP